MAKLQVVATVSEAFKGAFTHIGEMVRLVWVPGLAYIGLSAVGVLFQMREQAGLASLMNLLTIFLWPVIAVAWHRFILLGETGSGVAYFRFGQREARFLVVSIFLVLLLLPGFIVMMLGFDATPEMWAQMAAGQPVQFEPTEGGTIFVFSGLVLLAAAAFYSVRLSLLLPAVAVDQPVDARAVLDMTRGNFWRLVGAFVLLALGVLVIMLMLMLVAGLLATLLSVAAFALALIATMIVAVFSQIASVAILSIAYRELSGGGPAPPAPQSQQL